MWLSGGWTGFGAQGGEEVGGGRLAAWIWAPAGPGWPRGFAGHGPTWIGGWGEDRRPRGVAGQASESGVPVRACKERAAARASRTRAAA